MIPYTAEILERWELLVQRLDELQPLTDDLPGLIEELFPPVQQGEEDDFAILRSVAMPAARECETVRALHDTIRYRLAQPEVPLETPYARVMSFHKSKGLTADVVVMAGLVQGLIPRIDEDATEQEQRAVLEEQRRLFFVGMTRTSRVLVFSSYFQLEDRVVRQLNIPFGRRRGRFLTTLASRFLNELGSDLPNAVRGQDWQFT